MTRDEFLYKQFGGELHKVVTEMDGMLICSCGKSAQGMGYYDLMETHLMNQTPILDLNTDPGFRWLWVKMRDDDVNWERFISWLWLNDHRAIRITLPELIDNPSHFADACAEFFGYGKGEE